MVDVRTEVPLCAKIDKELKGEHQRTHTRE